MTKSIAKSVAALAVMIAVAGCGVSRPGTKAVLVPLGPISVITSVDQITRPIDAYVPTVTDINKLTKGMDIVQARCMKGFNLPYQSEEIDGLAQDVLDYIARTPLYGYFGTDTQLDKGYDMMRNPSAADNSASVPQVAVNVFNGKNSAGTLITSYQGKKVPPGGCQGAGAAAVGGFPPMPTTEVLPDGGPRTPASDPRLVAIYAKWAQCMKTKGYGYSTPMAAFLDPQWQPHSAAEFQDYTVSPVQIATVTADLDCKKSTNLIGVAIAVESAYDNQYIKSHKTQLAKFQMQLDARVAKAEQIIAGNSNATERRRLPGHAGTGPATGGSGH